MIYYHARKPIRDFLNKVTEPPYTLTNEERNRFIEAIVSIYEESTNKERQAFLVNDTFDLLRTFAVEDKTIQLPRDSNWLAMTEIRDMLAVLIAYAQQLGVRLPESELHAHGYEDLRFMADDSFVDFVRDIYEPVRSIVPKELPEPLNNDTFKGILQRGMKNKIIIIKADGSYKWNKLNQKGEPSKVLLAYFAEAVCGILKLESQSNGNIVWHPFEKMFGITGLRGAKASWYKVRGENDLFRPDGWEEIFKILHDNNNLKLK